MSLSDLAELPDKLLPPDDADPKAIKRYRLRTALVACSAFLTVGAIVLPAMFVGLPKIGQLAWAGEVDDKIAAAFSPLDRRLTSIESIQIEILRGQYSQQIRDLHRARCTSTDEHVRRRMDGEIDTAQAKYRNLTGERYPLPACKDL